MKARKYMLLLLALCCLVGFSGCRRAPAETETSSETVKETTSETAKVTETQKQTTEKQTETQQQTVKKTSVTPSTQTPQTQTAASETQAQTTENAAQQCPYCYNWFSTTLQADGTSEYSTHVAAEESYLQSIQSSTNAADDSYTDDYNYQTGADGNLYAQCPYCFQWFPDTTNAGGYSQYADHVAAEVAYAAQIAGEDLVQCPNCGNWVTPEEYQDHINNGW